MQNIVVPNKLTIAGAVLGLAIMAGAVGFAVTGPTSVAYAQEDDGSIPVEWHTGDAYEEPKGKTKAKAKGGSDPLMECEAMERTKARWAKWLNEGVPEQFGSEEPFTFDKTVC